MLCCPSAHLPPHWEPLCPPRHRRRRREEQLISFLKGLEADSQQLGVTDIQLSLTSLEEVFLTIARKVGGAGREHAAAATAAAAAAWHTGFDRGRGLGPVATGDMSGI
jgi:hypothetical protein